MLSFNRHPIIYLAPCFELRAVGDYIMLFGSRDADKKDFGVLPCISVEFALNLVVVSYSFLQF